MEGGIKVVGEAPASTREIGTGTSILFDKQLDNHVKGYHPLGDVFKSSVGSIKHLDLQSDECVTDAVLYKLAQAPGWDFKQLETINLSGCVYVTDQGIKWLSQIIKKSDSFSELSVDGLEHVTDNCFLHIVDATTLRVKVKCAGSGVRFVKPYEDKLIIDAGEMAIDEVFSDRVVEQSIGHVVVCPEKHSQYSLTSYIGQKRKEALKPLYYHCGAGIAWTEISPVHPWFDKIVPEEPSLVVIPYDNTANVDDVKEHVFSIIKYFIGRSPPVFQTYNACQFIVAGIGGEHSGLKQADLNTSLGIKQLEGFVQEKERTLDYMNQIEQEQYTRALKMLDNLKAFTKATNVLEFITIKLDDMQDFLVSVTNKISADRQQRPHHYSFPWQSTSVFKSLSEQHGFAVTLDKFDEGIGDVIKSGDLRRDKLLVQLLHNLGRCIYLENNHEPLVILNISWFFDLLNDLLTSKMTACNNLVPSVAPDVQGLAEDQLKTLVKTCGQDYCPLMRLITTNGPAVIVPCRRPCASDIDKFVSFYLQNAPKPPIPLDHYWKEGKEEKNLYSACNIFKLVHHTPGDLLSRVVALAANVSRFQLLSAQGYVVHQGAVEVILFMKSASEIILEARTISPPGKESLVNEKKDLRQYLWSVLNLHHDILEYILKNVGVIYTVVRKGGDYGPWNYSICSHHTWEKPIVGSSEMLKKITVCTLCQNCSCDGTHCDHNGVPSVRYRECGCETDVTACWHCGICRRCAEIVWRVRSYLRPNQGAWKPMLLKDLRNPHCKMFLTATDITVTFNELEIFSPENAGPYVALIDIGGASNLQVFPGTVRTINKPVDELMINDLNENMRWKRGDKLKIRVTSPKLSIQDTNYEAETHGKTLFHHHICRRVRVWQAEGIVAYTPLSSSPPVGLYAAQFPLTPNNNYFEIKVIDKGQKGTISFGFVPANYPNDNQVGWRDRSVGYHGDDGGCFLSSGFSQKNLPAWKKGDVIGCGVDFNDDETKSVYFTHNGTKKYVLTGVDRLPTELYAAIGFHSKHEKVQILTENVWRTTGTAQAERSTFKDPDTFYGVDVQISPNKKLLFEKASGWGDKRISCVFVKNTSSTQLIVLTVIPQAKDYFVEDFSATVRPGEVRVVYIRSDCQDANKDLTGNMFHVKWEGVSPNMEPEDCKRIADQLATSQTAGVNCLKLRFEWAGTESAQSKLKPFDEEKPKGDSEILEVLKNGMMISKYWVPRAGYHVQLAFPESVSNTIDAISVHMPRQATFDLPRDFEPGMLLEYSPPGMDVFVVGSVKEVKQNGQLVIEPKFKPKDVEVVLTTLDAKSSSVKPIARPPYEVPKLKGIEPNDLWDVAPPTLFTKDQITFGMVEHLWGFCIKRGTRCKGKTYLYTVQATKLAGLSSELLLSEFTSHLSKELLPCTFLPKGIDAAFIEHPSINKLANVTELNIHPLCYPVNQVHQNLVPMTSPHILDSPGVQASIEPDAMFRDLATAWSFIILGTKQSQLGAWTQLIPSSPDSLQAFKDRVNSQLQQIFGIYAATVTILANQHGGILELEESEAHRKAMKMVLKPLIIQDKQIPSGDWCDPHKAISITDDPEYVCIGHFYCKERDSWPRHVKFKPELFTPYEADQAYLELDLGDVDKFPEDFCSKFENLEYFHLKKAHKLVDLPPDFYISFPKLHRMILFDTSLKNLPDSLCALNLTRVQISACMLTSIPEAICNLPSLSHLDLSENPISQVTPSIGKLKHTLKVLNLSGIPWINFQKSSGLLAPDWYKRDGVSPLERLNVRLISEKKYDKLFKDCDLDRNRMLDAKELPNMNAQMFYMVNRIGLDYEPGDADGGFPMEILQLEELEVLTLENQAIREIPQEIGNLKKLYSLSLKYNPLLEAIPGTIGTLESLRVINLRNCPSLKTPPIEIVGRGIVAIKAYLKYLAADETECHRTKLMLVGLGGAGKTSLLRALTSGEYKTKATVGEDITDGIDIGSWTLSRDDGKEITFSTWDFAGQTIYYNTHQFFLSKRAVYLLLWTTRLGYEHAGLDFWLSSISCHAPDTPIFVVGTHCDQVAKVELPRGELKERYKQIIGFHFVSSIDGTGIRELQEELLSTALNQPYMGERIPQLWLDLERRVIDSRRTTSIMKWKDLQTQALDVGIFDEKDTKQAVQLLHDLGTVQYFDNEFLCEHVVINPQWIVDVMSCVVSVKETPIRDGKFYHKDMRTIWKREREELHKWLLKLTERFDLTFPLLTEDSNLVPCLLPQKEPVITWVDTSSPENDCIREMKIVYKFSYLPAGLFNRAQVRLFEYSDSSCIWKQGSLLSKNGHQALIRQTNDQELVVRVQGLRPQNIVFMIHEVFELLIQESFNGVQCELFLPCPDCLNKEKTRNPALMTATLIRHAMELKAPYLQCRKYFHTISMPELQAIVPPDSTLDFDIQMEASILLLRDLRQEMATDIFFLYCGADLQANGGGPVCPARIKADLEKEGYKVNFPCPDTSVEDMTLGLKDCKILIVCMSNDFENFDQLCDLFVYARDTLGKPFLVCGTGENMNWQRGKTSGKMAFVVSDVVYINFTRSDTYDVKMTELKAKTKDKLAKAAAEKKFPQCFVSYCWKNSQEAIKDGLRVDEDNTLGWADPRDIKTKLEEAGISCWLDVEQAGAKGLFEDISDGIKYSDVVLACVSKEYKNSVNCMMELRFAVTMMEKPVVFAVVGQGDEWELGEIGMLISRRITDMNDPNAMPKINFQEENKHAYNKLIAQLKAHLPEGAHGAVVPTGPRRMRGFPRPGLKKADNNIVFQEEYELLQRKYLRQVTSFPMEGYYPRLFVLDFADPKREDSQENKLKVGTECNADVSEVKACDASYSEDARKTPRPGTAMRREATLINDGGANSDDWREARMCFRVLCEDDQGWHESSEPINYNVSADRKVMFINSVAPYLIRMYNILRHSGIKLKCLSGEKGEKYMSYIRECVSSDVHADLEVAYRRCQDMVRRYDPERKRGNLDRCLLPSGKLLWLCKDHQKNKRIIVLNSDTSSGEMGEQVIFEEDLHLKEALVKYAKMAQPYLMNRPPTKKKHPMPETTEQPGTEHGKTKWTTAQVSLTKKFKAATVAAAVVGNYERRLENGRLDMDKGSKACMIL